MRARYYNSFNEFENDTHKSDYEMVAIVNNESKNTMCADLLTECKSYKTAIKRFFSTLTEYSQFDGWMETITGCIENGIWNDRETYNGKYTGGYHWSVEETSENVWYICLNA